MLDSLLVTLIVMFLTWFWKKSQHSKKFPPGPRFPVPVLGDAYVLGDDLEKGFKKLILKHGKICGLWLGPQRAVVVADFEILQEVLNKAELSDRQHWALENLSAMRNGLSLGSIPGVLFSSGPTWTAMRRTSLHTLRDFGLGKSVLEDIIEEEVDNLIEHIDNNCLNEPIDVISFFHISVLASLWRIISGEHLKIGDPNLEHLIDLIQTLIKEFGNPLVDVSMNYVWMFKLLNKLGKTLACDYAKVHNDTLKILKGLKIGY